MHPFPLVIRTRGPVAALALVGLILVLPLFNPSAVAAGEEPLFARCDTDSGSILLVLYPQLAPNHGGSPLGGLCPDPASFRSAIG